jgi:hypothetical protein
VTIVQEIIEEAEASADGDTLAPEIISDSATKDASESENDSSE